MMESQVDRELLEKIADLTGKPVGAFNIRKDSGCEARQSTEHIDITPRADGKQGIDIRIKAGTKGEKCYIPVIISQTGLQEVRIQDVTVRAFQRFHRPAAPQQDMAQGLPQQSGAALQNQCFHEQSSKV